MSTELGVELDAGDRLGVSLSAQHMILANSYRRLTMDILEGETGPLSLEDLATHLARSNTATDSISEDLDEISILLHHCHLPKLAAHGIIEYDRTERIVTRG